MKRAATQSNKGSARTHGLSFLPVFDSRKRKVPGLWQRGSRYYAQLRVDQGNGRTSPRRFALNASNLDEAKGELDRKRTERRDGELPQTGHRPKFDDFAAQYVASPTLAQKKEGTQQNERQAIGRWSGHLGGLRVDKITAQVVYGFREKRLAGGASARTVNLDYVALRNVLKLAAERGLIEQLPAVRQLKQKPSPQKTLLTKEQFGALIAASVHDTTKNAALFRCYLRFLALTGAREKEALAVRWADVDFTRETVTIGSGEVSKNHKARAVDFSPELGALLRDMHGNRPPDSSWLFPSPQRGSKDAAAHTLRESLLLVRERAKLPKVAFHDLRHFFASQCVMAGLDFMTIASWLGHSDGGILVGKVYGHLADTQKKAAAAKLSLFAGGKSMNDPTASEYRDEEGQNDYPLDHVATIAAKLLEGDRYADAAERALLLLDACRAKLATRQCRANILSRAHADRKQWFDKYVPTTSEGKTYAMPWREALAHITGVTAMPPLKRPLRTGRGTDTEGNCRPHQEV